MYVMMEKENTPFKSFEGENVPDYNLRVKLF